MPVNSGWANDCGIELFAIGWIPCGRGFDSYRIIGAFEQDSAIPFQGWYNGLTQTSERSITFKVGETIVPTSTEDRDEFVKDKRRKSITITRRRTFMGGRKRR